MYLRREAEIDGTAHKPDRPPVSKALERWRAGTEFMIALKDPLRMLNALKLLAEYSDKM
jgi:hypothetical protein